MDSATLSRSPLATLSKPRRPWTAIHNWIAWLNGPRLDQIAGSAYELAVIDYSADGTAAGAFGADQIEAVRHATCERRILAYLSIGEAEAYRWYWQPRWTTRHPAWIVEEEKDWPGNYRVRYWTTEWRTIVYRYLDRIIAAGFDGVYLNRVDAYAEPYAHGHERAMVSLVGNLARYARARSPLGKDFGIVVQNAEGLAPRHPAFVGVVTGICREEVYVRATDLPTPWNERAAAEDNLESFRRHSLGRLVLTIDYADRPALVRLAYERSGARGFVPYVGDVALDRMRVNPGFAPICHPFRLTAARHVCIAPTATATT